MANFFHENIKKIAGVALIIVIASCVALKVHREVTEAAVTESKILVGDGAAQDYFGYSVDIDGDYAIFGVERDDIGVNADQGSAYIFYNDPGMGWIQQAKLTSSDGAASDRFGGFVSISGDYVVVGAWQDGDAGWGTGSAYIFVKPGGGWSDMTQTAKLTASDMASGDYFGWAVTIEGDVVAVGAWGDSISAPANGSVYVYVKPGGGWSNMTQTAKLTASDRAINDYLGNSVSISGDTIIAGAYGDDADKGSAYIFVKPGGGWSDMTQTAKLTASDGMAADYFGTGVSVSGDTAVIGAYANNSNRGAAYVFVKPGGDWSDMTQTAKLTASDATTNHYLGWSVSIFGDYVIAGAFGESLYRGSAYTYIKPDTGWVDTTEDNKLLASDGVGNDYFGYSVSISDTSTVVSAYRDDDNGFDAGSAYIYDYSCTDVTADFTDANFESCVETAIGTPGIICAEDAATLISLNCDSQSISSIAGAEHLTSLTSLGLDNNDISDISPIAGLTDLSQIWLANSSISDISALSGMTDLYRLVLHGNNVSDISALSGLTNMLYLYMNENDVTDLSPLTNLMSLELLDLNNNNISDLSVLADKTSLTELTLNGNEISDISFLSGLTGLIELRLNGNNIVDLSPLSAMANLTELWLENNDIVDPSTLSDMTNLIDLDLNDNYISDITSLASGNLNIVRFAGGNAINLDDNPLCDPDDFDEIDLLETNGAIVNYDTLVCGDGNPSTKCTEQCDDGNLVSGDGCSSTCQGEYYGCFATYTVPPVTLTHSVCNKSCQTFRFAGGWSPDPNSCICYISNSRACDNVCTAADAAYPGLIDECGFIRCGNGIVEPDGVWPAREECDDGNLVSGDGCSSICEEEAVGGGTSQTQAPTCSALPVRIDLAPTVPVTQIGGETVANLNWSRIFTEEVNAEQKIGILFDYFNQSVKPVIGANKKRVENVFAKYIYTEMLKDAELASMLKSKVGAVNYENLAKCDCDNTLASTAVNAIKAMRMTNSVKDRVNTLIVNFANDILAVEAVIAQAGSGIQTPFTDFYNNYFPSGVYEGISVEIYRNGSRITTIDNPAITSYSDDGILANTSGMVQYYKYYLLTKNNCGDSLKGSEGQAKVDPQVPEGTDVQVSIDLSIKIKDAYSLLFMDKLKELLIANGSEDGYPEEENACEQARQSFIIEKKNESMFSYILECFAGYDYSLRQKLEAMESDIVQPISSLLILGEDDETRENIVEQYMYPIIYNLNQKLALEILAKSQINNLVLNKAAIMNKNQIGDLTETEMNEIRKLNERIFEGAGHAADLIIEKYDSTGTNLIDTYYAHTDVFGITKGVSVGSMTAGQDYIFEIWLKDPDSKTDDPQKLKYVLPHKVILNVSNAILIGGEYKTTIALDFPKHFRYGDFNGDREINLQDIIGWGLLLKDKPEEWQSGNLDGLQGINILDVLTLQQNWGKLGETRFGESQMSLAEFFNTLGLADRLSLSTNLTTRVLAPSWLNVVSSVCP